MGEGNTFRTEKAALTVGSAHLILIGYRGTGKTTAGRALAARLNRAFFDADERVEAVAGCSIADIFARGGEPEFRDREAAALADLCAGPPAVLATGGGAILREANRALLKASGFVVWLVAPPEVLWGRICADAATAARRPNLTASGGEAEVRALLAAREPLYRATADFAVDCAAASPETVADAILSAWTGNSTCPSSSGASGCSPSG